MRKIRCLAIDDEKPALDLLSDNIGRIPFLELAGTCRNAMEALSLLQTQQIDLVFLDINMPGLTGLQLAKTIGSRTMVIFLTAYDHYAVEGFAVNAVDYLLKPASFERFLQSCMKAYELFTLRNTPPPAAVTGTSGAAAEQAPARFIYVYVEYSLVKIDISDILYIEGFKDYVKIHLSGNNRPVITRMSMKMLEEKLQPFAFFRSHKSYIIPLKKVSSIHRNAVMIDKVEVPLSDSYKEALMKIIQTENLL
jgi:DNA-binding LytR/AlgR family response regulator